MTLLATRDLRKAFGGLVALDGVSIEVERGELVGVIGPNGAGKTTLFHCLTGILEPDGGTVTFDSRDVTGAEPYRLARRGLVRTFQQTRELSTMTVRENVRLPALDHPGERTADAVLRTERAVERERAVRQRAEELLEFFELDHLSDAYASELSGGQRKLLEFARALVPDPDLLLLDEPFAGVNPVLTQKLTERIGELNDDGQTFLVIEHDIDTLSTLVDRLIVLSEGQLLAEGPPDEVLRDDRVVDSYLGEPRT